MGVGALQDFGAGQGSSRVAYSLVSVMAALWSQHGPSAQSRAGIGFLLLCYFVFACLVPVAQLVCLVVLWCRSLTLLRRSACSCSTRYSARGPRSRCSSS